MSQASEEDVREIDELDKIRYINRQSGIGQYFVFSILKLSWTLVAGFVLLVTGVCLFFITDLIIAYEFTGGVRFSEDVDIIFVIVLGSIMVPVCIFVLLFTYGLVIYMYRDQRCIVRFKITQSGANPLEHNSSVVTALTDALVKRNRKWFSSRWYIRIEPEYNQLELIRVYLSKKYLRDVSVRDCWQLFSMGKLKVKGGDIAAKSEIKCFFVMLDEKKGEVLFSSDEPTDWPYLRNDLEKSGFLLSDVSKKTIDMRDYLIYRDGSIKRRKKGKEEGNTPSLQDSDMINV